MGRQAELAGMEHPHGDKELDEMIEGRRKTSKQRKKWQDRETSEGADIVARLREKGIKFYVNRNFNPPLYAKLKDSSKLEIDEYEEATGGGVEELPDVEPTEQKARKKSAPSAVEA